ncbi:transporter [Ideonella sp. DXS22W]|uniref:Transporter n=1 Tax=Pseudaquabacterium inlustre TaxID=2984192 RepID=A0ABU9CCB4_9BURK
MSTPLTHPLPAYGADEHGLICGYRCAPGQAPEALPALGPGDEVLEAPPGGFVWLHFNLGHTGAEPWLRRHAGLEDSFFEDLSEGSRATRIEREGDALFAVINDVTYDFSFDASDVATLWVWVTERLVVSARRHPLRSIDRLRMAVKRGDTLDTSLALLDHLLRDQADELQRIVRRVANRLDDIEDAVLAGHHERHTAELGRLRRLMVRLQRLLAPEPGALMRTLANPPRWVSGPDRQGLNHASEEFALVLRDVGAVQERIKLMQDEAATRVAEENNRSLFVLTMVTVLALPINLIAGLMGMNVGGIPLADHPHGFWAMLAIIAVLTAAIAGLVLWRLRPRRS